MASVANTFQPSVEVTKSLDLIDSSLPWITARPGNVPLVTPLLSGYIAGNGLYNVIAVGNKYIKSYSGCNLIDGALDHTRMSAKKLRLELL